MLVVSNLSYALPNGDALFSNLSFTCTDPNHVTAIIGRNGIGKSSLLQCIVERRAGVSFHGDMQCYQQSSVEQDHDLRVIDMLGLGQYFDALKRVEAGIPNDLDIDLLEQHWDVRERAKLWLKQASLSVALDQPAHTLSGGQRAKLRLLKLLHQTPELLVLDEPSNHLDKASTEWLIKALHQTSSMVLLVSHDATLLRSCQHFLVLDETGITPYHGDFDNLQTLLAKQRLDTAKAINQVKSQLKKEQLEQRIREQRAEQRQRQGLAKRHSGSQSKLLLDQKKNKAQNQSGAQKRLAEQREQQLKTDLAHYQSQQTSTSGVKLSLSSNTKGQRRILDIVNGVLPYGDPTPITMSLDRGDRLRLAGPNGSGKSTLIQCVQGLLPLSSGELTCRSGSLYLDQHLSLLDQYSSPLELLEMQLPELEQSDRRTYLGNIGLRGDRAFIACSHLSGGERMKVALLLISLMPSEGLLILDETDNHLDLDSREQLIYALNRYLGALIFVTHQDHWLSADKEIHLTNAQD